MIDTPDTQTAIQFGVPAEIEERVQAAFVGYIGQEEAVYAVMRALRVALTKQPVALTKVMLFFGPSSAGKTEMARRVGSAMGLPFKDYGGKSVTTAKQVVAALERAAAANSLKIETVNTGNGTPIYKFPPMIVFFDEVQAWGPGLQDAMLTAFEGKDRSIIIERDRAEIKFDVARVGFILATTHPSKLKQTLRNRCAQVPFRSYEPHEVARMIQLSYPLIERPLAMKMATAAKSIPRVALDQLAATTLDEATSTGNGNLDTCFRTVARGAGIVSYEGLTRNDLTYLDFLRKWNGQRSHQRPASLETIKAGLADLDPGEIENLIEPFLFKRGDATKTERGRFITDAGYRLLDQFADDLPKDRVQRYRPEED